MLTPKQMAEIDAVMLEPEDLMEAAIESPILTEIDQLTMLNNSILMLQLTAKDMEVSPHGRVAETALHIRFRCEEWREAITDRLRRLNR